MSDPIPQAREALVGADAADDMSWPVTVTGMHALMDALAALIEHAEQVERERDFYEREVNQADATVKLLRASRDEWKAKAEARPQVTDGMVERAVDAWWRHPDGPGTAGEAMRAALEAALGGES